jgi:hypothetical protein
VLEKEISSRSRRDETRSSTTGRNEIIDDCLWISYDYQELSSKIGRAGGPKVRIPLALPEAVSASPFVAAVGKATFGKASALELSYDLRPMA